MGKPRVTVKADDAGRYAVVSARAQAYEGATQGRRAAGWTAPASGPNRTLNGSLPTLRNRSRQAVRNNPWLERAISRNVTNEIGTGITPIFESPDPALNELLKNLWWTWTGQTDPEGALDFYGQLAQASRCRRTAGECFIRLRYRPPSWGLAVPIQLQVIEPDHVPESLNQDLPNGNRIIAGKEFSKRGRLVAIWAYPEHPQDGQGSLDMSRLIRIRASEIIHHYLPLRPGQVRGEPDIVPALLRARTYDSYEDAELVRKETRAPFTGFLQKEYIGEDGWAYDPVTGEPLDGDDPLPEINAQPGTIITGAMGESLTLFDGDKVGDGYADFQNQQLLAIAAGAKSLRELMTGDWSKINDRVYRAMIGEYRREIMMAQEHLCIHQICDRVGYWFTDAAVLSGAITAADYSLKYEEYNHRGWRPQRWPHINPQQDVEAIVKEIENDLTSLDQANAERGNTASEVQKANVDAKKRKADMMKKAGLPTGGENNA